MKKKYKFSKFLEDMNENTLSFFKKYPNAASFTKINQHSSRFTKKKITYNVFSVEKNITANEVSRKNKSVSFTKKNIEIN